MSLIVGCPVRDRAWILPHWFEHLEIALRHASIDDALLVFAGDPTADPETFAAIDAGCLKHSFSRIVIETGEGAGPYKRVWGMERYREMAVLRNRILGTVRSSGPDLYWSLDSDILVAERTLASALEALEERPFQAVGQRCYMTPEGTWCPSWASLTGGGLKRSDAEGLFQVDVIMAAKLMTPAAYQVDYQVHRQGEDIGWSIAARQAGCKLGWDGRTVSKHVMSRDALERIDPRCGF